MPITLRKFIDELNSSFLLDEDDVAQCLERFGIDCETGDAETFSSMLVADEYLTPFQASAALQERSGALVIGDYHVLDVIGSGGMGQVYKARHRIMKRLVAIKIMHTAKAANPKLVRRFYREVEAVARLSHPNIVTAYDAGETPGGLYLAMEYVKGVDLSVILRSISSIETDQAINVVLQVANGLTYAHQHNVIHRDIKPGNLLVSRDGTVKILDMGLARFTEDEAADVSLTMIGPLMGTVEYMAPEHAANARDADHRSDIYSLGCTMYRMLTGRLPYGGETPVEKLIAQREHPIPQLSDKVSDIPEALQDIFARMVAKDPDDRYQSMEECLSDLQDVARKSKPCDISVLTDREFSTATTIFEEGPADADTTITYQEDMPTVTLDVAGMMQPPATETEPSLMRIPTVSDEDTSIVPQRQRRRSLGLLLAAIAIVIGILLGIGLRTFFKPGQPPSRPPLSTQWHDFIRDIDIDKDAVAGKWNRLPKGSLMASAGGSEHARMMLPVVSVSNYQMRIVFRRIEGDRGLGLILPLGGSSRMSIEIDGAALTTTDKHTCLVSVEINGDLVRVLVEFNGQVLSRYEAPAAELQCSEEWSIPTGRIGFGVHKDVSAQIHEISARRVERRQASSRPST
ncbi:MAG: serine/threonine protein kinase [bacterium]|nr:serine/threonine protein kinase [bacterium]